MFINHIYRHARENPDRLAVVNSGEEISYRRFANTIETVRNFLMRARLPDDGVIVNITSNLYCDWVLLLALRSLGHTTVSGTSWRVIDGLHIRNIAGLVCLSNHVEAMAAFRSALPDRGIVEVPRQMLLGSNESPPPPPLADGRFGDHIVYTSGTTGTYKKLAYNGNELVNLIEVESIGQSGYTSPDDVYHNHSFGPWTAAGQRMVLITWFAGAVVIFEQRKNWPDHFFDYPVTKTFFVPALLDEVTRRAPQRADKLTKLRILVGGGFVDAQLARSVIRKFDCTLYIVYGGTEFHTALETEFRNDEDVIWLEPTRVTDAEIVDDAGRPVPHGVEGIIRVKRGPGLASSYLDEPDATARHFHDGYFYPGDMAVQREDRRIRILGRADDVLNLGGQKIAIEPFEATVRKVLRVESLCAFNHQDNTGKEMLVIVIEGSQLPERTRLQEMTRQLKQVDQIRFLLINRFPRGENGMMKINRRKVLELVRENLKKPVNLI